MHNTEKQITDEQIAGLVEFPTEQEFLDRDRRACDCALTYVHRKYHSALGSGIEIKLCCMAKKVEEMAGLPPGTFFFEMDFLPTWEWDCDKMRKEECKLDDGSIEVKEVRLGTPPEWLLKRMQEKNIPVRNLPDGD